VERKLKEINIHDAINCLHRRSLLVVVLPSKIFYYINSSFYKSSLTYARLNILANRTRIKFLCGFSLNAALALLATTDVHHPMLTTVELHLSDHTPKQLLKICL
jgi:hypothetical protein